MKKIITLFFVFMSITIFAQKKQYRTAAKAFKKGDISLSASILTDNIALFENADEKIKNQVKF